MTRANESAPSSPPPSARTRLRRHADRAHYDEASIDAILDEGFVCHVAIASDEGPVVLPTAYARVDDRLYLHGAAANAVLRALSSGAPACITVTHVDGLVLARSTFRHSINYRSVVIFGTATEVVDEDEKRKALEAIVEHLVPGRGADARPPNEAELRMTCVVWVPLDEVSAKIRSGGPADEEADLSLAVWAGEIPLSVVAGAPIVDSEAPVLAPCPDYAAGYSRRAR